MQRPNKSHLQRKWIVSGSRIDIRGGESGSFIFVYKQKWTLIEHKWASRGDTKLTLSSSIARQSHYAARNLNVSLPCTARCRCVFSVSQPSFNTLYDKCFRSYLIIPSVYKVRDNRLLSCPLITIYMGVEINSKNLQIKIYSSQPTSAAHFLDESIPISRHDLVKIIYSFLVIIIPIYVKQLFHINLKHY